MAFAGYGKEVSKPEACELIHPCLSGVTVIQTSNLSAVVIFGALCLATGLPDVAPGRREAGFQPATSSWSALPTLQPDVEQKQGGPVGQERH